MRHEQNKTIQGQVPDCKIKDEFEILENRQTIVDNKFK